ncbi:MAG TPA: TIGR00268 family protein, partial [Actinomycetota bacterium]|nr:TIGR00268 family protein [Actinomycetota bacterium]
PLARMSGADVAVGTNLDDLSDYRPGSRAAEESGVATPFLVASLAKAEIRSLSADLGLPTSEKPASPCLSSRFAYGVRVTPEGLRRVDAAEDFVRSLGFEEFRVRDHGDGLARLEVLKDDIPRAAELAETIAAGLHDLGFGHVSLDMSGFRSGSLNAALPLPTLRK